MTRSPIVSQMRVIPVAGHDSMLLNLSGAHGPFFIAARSTVAPRGSEPVSEFELDAASVVDGVRPSSGAEMLEPRRA